MPKLASISLDHTRLLQVHSIGTGKTVSVKLSRLSAQLLADALLQHAGAQGKAAKGVEMRTMFAAEDETGPSFEQALAARRSGPVKVLRGSVRLTHER